VLALRKLFLLGPQPLPLRHRALLFLNMAIDMVESLQVAFNPAGEHDDNLPAKAAPVLPLRPASYTLGVAKIVHLVLIRNIV
jgi:hypothetical protein